jgi:hypothetical protein
MVNSKIGEVKNMWILIGLSLNFVGTIMVAFSIKRGTVQAWQEKDKNPKMQYMILYSAWMFRTGIRIIAAGFLFQIAGVTFPKIFFL